ncbi:hypothetical protein [Nocardia sp. NPDC050435]|uniref:hypothetical protein n=1 Tax=Nocardia sp. NPDC050435 TaxID=3155040 RepID=UPI00340F30FD
MSETSTRRTSLACAIESAPASVSPLYSGEWTSLLNATLSRLDPDVVGQPYPNLQRPRPTEAARLAAHAIRLHQRRHGDNRAAWALSEPSIGHAISSSDNDIRFPEGLLLLRLLPGLDHAEAEPFRLIGKWLTAEPGDEASSGHLVRWLRMQWPQFEPELGQAWWVMHGDQLIAELAEGSEAKPGRPASAEELERGRLRAAVCQRWTAGEIAKTRLAALAKVSRPTLDAWLSSS